MLAMGNMGGGKSPTSSDLGNLIGSIGHGVRTIFFEEV